MAHSPRHQAARQRGAQTGERFEQAWQGIRQDRCDYQRPIPDAATLAQQRLEAAVVYALVEGFRHEWGVVDRAALAIGSVHPEPDRLTIDPVPGRELEVLTALLPYYDGRPGQMGNFFGVPGLRLRPDGQDRDYWELGWLDETGRDRGTQLRIRRPRPRPGAHLLPPTPGSGTDGQPGPQEFYRELAPLWHTHPRSISGVERDRDLRGYCDYPADQAELLSRLLRRPRLLVWPAGRGARAVCLYHHARLDLVVEWFGGPPVAKVAAAFLGAGLDLQPSDRAAQGLKDGTWPQWTLKLHAGTMELVLLPQVEPPTKLPRRRRRSPPIGHDRRGHGSPVSDGDGRLRPQAEPDLAWDTRPMSTDTNDSPEPPESQPGPASDDPIRRALQYRWLSTDRWHDPDLGLLEACGSRHDVELVLIQAEQGYWAGDFDSYGRAPSWLRRLQAHGQRRRRR